MPPAAQRPPDGCSVPFVTETVQGGARLVLSGDVTIVEATSFHAALVELAGRPDPVVVDDSRVTGFDVTLLQLVVAFAEARRRAGRAMRTADGPPSRRLAALGLCAPASVLEA
jgi:hypothetical protein